MNEYFDGCLLGWMDEWIVERQLLGWTGGLTDGCLYGWDVQLLGWTDAWAYAWLDLGLEGCLDE